MPSIQFAEGFLLGLGLLVALGPKDTFVIKNSLGGQNALMLVAICTLSDVLLICLGVAGLGAVVSAHQWLMVSAMVLSIAYLVYFGVQALRSVYAGQVQPAGVDGVIGLQGTPAVPRAQVVRGALFHSLLTPYAWLDTVLVIGAISATKMGLAKFSFAGGAMLASLLWFVFLTTGSRFAAPMFRSRRAWQGLDLLVAVSMLVLAAKLLGDYPWRSSVAGA